MVERNRHIYQGDDALCVLRMSIKLLLFYSVRENDSFYVLSHACTTLAVYTFTGDVTFDLRLDSRNLICPN